MKSLKQTHLETAKCYYIEQNETAIEEFEIV